MSDTVLKFLGEALTRREIELARYAEAKGRCAAMWAAGPTPDNAHRARIYDEPCGLCRKQAAARWPLPRVTRPRIVRVTDKAWADREFRYVGGQLQSRTRGLGPSAQAYAWTPLAQITPTPETVTVLADLIARPTEQVEADE